MTKYNLNDNQQRILRELVEVYASGYDQEFQYLGRIGAMPSITFWGRKEAIPASKSDLQALSEENFITIRRESSGLFGTLKKMAFDAVAGDFQMPDQSAASSISIGNVIQTMSGGNVQGAVGREISMTQNIDSDSSVLLQRFDELTDQFTAILTQGFKGADLRDAMTDISAIQGTVKTSSPQTDIIAKKTRSLSDRLLTLLDIGDKTSGSIQTAIFASEALVVLGGWLTTAYQIIWQIAR